VPEASQSVARDALLSLLFPLWQLVIAVVLVGVLAVAARRLAHRGRSRMTTAVLITGAAVLATAVAILLASAPSVLLGGADPGAVDRPRPVAPAGA
jgi:hypothetical protein